LLLEGGFDPDGQFSFLPIHDTARLTQVLRQRTVGLFLKLGLSTGPPLGHPCPRRPSPSTRLRALARSELVPRSARYIARVPLSPQKLTHDRAGGKVLYHTSCNPYLKQDTSLRGDAGGPFGPGDFARFLQAGNELVQRSFGGRFGAVERGASADLVVIDYRPPTPLVAENVAGRVVLEGRRFPFDTEPVLWQAREAARRLWRNMDALTDGPRSFLP
jgi:hypothetical protein